MAINTHGGAGRSFTDLSNLYDRLANIRGPGAGYTTYKDRTGQAPFTERAQTAIEDAILSPIEFITQNWKLLLIIGFAFILYIAD